MNRSGGAPGWSNSRNGGLGHTTQQRNSLQHRPASPSYQRHTSNLSISSCGSHQGSPGPTSAMSIPTSGIESDRYSSTSRELDCSKRRSLHSSPKHTPKVRQNEDHEGYYSSSSIPQRQLDRNYNRGTSNNGQSLQGANRAVTGSLTSAKKMPPSNLQTSPNVKTSSGNISTASSNYPDKSQSMMSKPGISSNNCRGIQSKNLSSSSQQSLTESPRTVRISMPPTITMDNTVSKHQSNMQQSRWQKLFSSFKKNKNGAVNQSGGNNHGSGPAHSEDAFSLKHSHNCSNSFLKAGISNMKGYKKANQDR